MTWCVTARRQACSGAVAPDWLTLAAASEQGAP